MDGVGEFSWGCNSIVAEAGNGWCVRCGYSTALNGGVDGDGSCGVVRCGTVRHGAVGRA